MKTPGIILTVMFWLILFFTANAQDYISPTKPTQTGRSPGVKVKLISSNGTTQTYAVIFAHNDEVMSGLNEFAQKYKVKSAHFTAIGDAQSAKIGWYDNAHKMFKVINIAYPSEITSMVGDIAMYNGKPSVHAHINLADSTGMVHGGHVLEVFVGPTLEVMMTVEPETLYKKLDTEFDAAVIDPSQK